MRDEILPPGEQDLWRANIYHLLTRLLARPPSQRLLAQLSEIPPLRPTADGNTVALAWAGLGEASRRAAEPLVFREFRALFGEEPGALVPHASWYLAGQLNAKPLQMLRAELTGLGISRADGPPEDHAGALCDTMGLLIETEDPRQIGFFTRHLKPWLPIFFGDVRGFPAVDFYRAVGSLGEAFIEIESGYLRKIY